MSRRKKLMKKYAARAPVVALPTKNAQHSTIDAKTANRNGAAMMCDRTVPIDNCESF
jgi:hypothetical protein